MAFLTEDDFIQTSPNTVQETENTAPSIGTLFLEVLTFHTIRTYFRTYVLDKLSLGCRLGFCSQVVSG